MRVGSGGRRSRRRRNRDGNPGKRGFRRSVLDVAADGKTYFGNVAIWTGSSMPSLPGEGPNATCSDWASNSQSMFAFYGVVYSIPEFFSTGGQTCNATGNHVYCLQQ